MDQYLDYNSPQTQNKHLHKTKKKINKSDLNLTTYFFYVSG